MATHSVWNPHSLKYDYYQAQGAFRDGVFAPEPKVGKSHRLGLTVEEAAYALPSAAKRIGSGDVPYGLISQKRTALGALSLQVEPLRLAIYVGAGWLVWNKVLTQATRNRIKGVFK